MVISMKILFAAAEALPFVATGGLADVAGSLPPALNARGADCRVVMPLYADIPAELRGRLRFLTSFSVPVSWRQQYCGVLEAEVNGVTYYLLDNEYYFKRAGIYGHYDDAERFAFFSKAVLEMLEYVDFTPDVIHANDWHTALVPIYFSSFYRELERFSQMRTVFTIHNIQYQGKYGREVADDVMGLPDYIRPAVEYEGCVNLMKGAMMAADALTTVSPTYARELQYGYFAHGLDSVVRLNAGKMRGILNGIDTTLYDPAADACIFANYSKERPAKKSVNKSELQKLVGLPQDKDALVVGMVGRLVEQKGVDLVRYVLGDMMNDHIQLVVLGKGDQKYESFFCEMEHRFPGKLAVDIGFHQDLARKIYAGSDVLLMPSKMEPCGLAQMIAMRYGTIPVVHETGGLSDSVRDCGEEGGTGFTFQSFNAHDMLGALRRAEGAFVQKTSWRSLVHRAMKSDFSWNGPAGEYLGLYESLLK